VFCPPQVPDLIGLGVANRLFPALRELVSYFGAPPRGDSLSVLALYRAGSTRDSMSSLSGCSEESAFLCLATRDRFRDVEGLTTLAVHECVHFYLGGAVSADGEPPYRNSPELVWLLEGVTEYLTYRLLETAGSLPPGESERVAIRKEREMLAAPAGLSLADAARRMETAQTYMLVYSRGYLVARLLERTMEARVPGSFAGALREFFESHNFYRERRTITLAVVREVFEARCPGIGSFLDRYAWGAEALPAVSSTQESGGAE
jgi:predicted metalloprotease with PDZ domain